MTDPIEGAERPAATKLAAALLAVSVALYVTSLTMNVARVTGHVVLDTAAIEREIQAQVGSPAALDKVSKAITAVVSGVVRTDFPLFANGPVFDRIATSVAQQVKQRGPAVIDELIPALEVPQPEPEVRRLKLLETIRNLWRDGDTFLAICLVMFTIFFPISKYVALITLLMGAARPEVRHRVLTWLKNWGQWSMGDVFVVAFLVVYLRINTSVVSTGTLANITVRVDVEPGMYLFAASVLLGMICSMLLASSER